MPLPEGAQLCNHRLRDRNLAGLATFRVVDPQHAAFAIDVFGPDLQGLAHAQSAVIHEGEVSSVSTTAERS